MYINSPKREAGWRLPMVSKDKEEKRSKLEQYDNHIYFYTDVETDECLDLLVKIRRLDADLRSEQIARGMKSPTPIWLHIHSYGGDLFGGFSTADQLKLIASPIYAVVEGVCASAATLIAMSCKKRYILPNSFMLIHQLSTLMWGTHEQFKDEMVLQQKAMERLIKFYIDHSKMSEAELKEMLKRDYWMEAEDAVSKGFVDAIMS
jgi:ATP-dependent protease ClpP protease subunit